MVFSKRGEKQFAPHGTKAVEPFAEIFLHLMGLVNYGLISKLLKNRGLRFTYGAETSFLEGIRPSAALRKAAGCSFFSSDH